MISAPVVSQEAFAGIADAVKIARSTLEALRSDPRISELGHKQLQVALDSLGASLVSPARSPTDFVARLADFKPACEALPQLARALFEEGYEERYSDVAGISDVVIWTEVIAASVQGHQRDVDSLLSWSSFTAAVGTSSDALTLGNLSDHCQSLIENLSRQKSGPAARVTMSIRIISFRRWSIRPPLPTRLC